eukprot:g1463.t1
MCACYTPARVSNFVKDFLVGMEELEEMEGEQGSFQDEFMVLRHGNSFVLMGDAKRLAMRNACGVAEENAIGPNAQIKKKYAQEKI